MAKDALLLLQSALKSPSIAKSRQVRKLLQYLYDNRGNVVTTNDIWNEVLEGDAGQVDGQRVRELASRLRKALEEIASVTETLNYFELPNADEPNSRGELGYRLTFPQRKQRKPTETFWRAHTRSDNVRLVYAEPVFFYDIVEGAYLRFVDTNPEPGKPAAMSELNAKHGSELSDWYKTPLSDRLKPTRDYVGTGEVAALDALREWFLKRSLLRTTSEASYRLAGLAGSCPILLGSMRTNHFIENLLNSQEGQVFSYRLDNQKIGFLKIRNPKPDESKALKNFDLTETNGSLNAGLAATLSQVRERLAIVQRLPLPGGRGFATMISSDTSLAIKQVTEALTDDEQMDGFIKFAEWKDEAIPDVFEMLFSVRIAPANIEHEAAIPELLAVR